MPGLELEVHEHRWDKLPDGSEALIVEGGGFDGGPGYFIANSPDPTNDLHVIGSTAPLIPGKIGAVAVPPTGAASSSG